MPEWTETISSSSTTETGLPVVGTVWLLLITNMMMMMMMTISKAHTHTHWWSCRMYGLGSRLLLFNIGETTPSTTYRTAFRAIKRSEGTDPPHSAALDLQCPKPD